MVQAANGCKSVDYILVLTRSKLRWGKKKQKLQWTSTRVKCREFFLIFSTSGISYHILEDAGLSLLLASSNQKQLVWHHFNLCKVRRRSKNSFYSPYSVPAKTTSSDCTFFLHTTLVEFSLFFLYLFTFSSFLSHFLNANETQQQSPVMSWQPVCGCTLPLVGRQLGWAQASQEPWIGWIGIENMRINEWMKKKWKPR